MKQRIHFHGPMTPDDAPPIATRHLCYGGMMGGGGGGGSGFWMNRPPDPAPPPPPPPPPEPPKLPDWLMNHNPYDIPIPKAPEPPPPPVVMPDPDPKAMRRQEIRKLAQARSRQTTRAATIIGSDDPLGG
jgi:hypothetical protein